MADEHVILLLGSAPDMSTTTLPSSHWATCPFSSSSRAVLSSSSLSSSRFSPSSSRDRHFPSNSQVVLPITQQSPLPGTFRLPISGQLTSRTRVAIAPRCTRFALPSPTVPVPSIWEGMKNVHRIVSFCLVCFYLIPF